MITQQKAMEKFNTIIQNVLSTPGNTLNFDKAVYSGYHGKVVISCNIHGEYEQTAGEFMRSSKKCPHCVKHERLIEMQNKNKKSPRNLTTIQFIEAAQKIHGNKFSYHLVNYVHSKIPVTIQCNTCLHVFNQTPNGHLSGKGCKKCALKISRNNGITACLSNAARAKMTTAEFISKAVTVHGNKYDYSAVEYVDTHTKVTIKCNTHGEFKQTPNSHISGEQGCPLCGESKGEKQICEYLDNRNIAYVREITIPAFSKIKRFDFYLPDFNLYIEFDGELHFKPFTNSPKHLDHLTQQQARDRKRVEWCYAHGIKLLIITHTDSIPDVLTAALTN